MAAHDTSPAGHEPVVPTSSRRPEPSAGLGARIRIWLLVMGLAMLAAGVAWPAGELTFDYFKPSRAASENYRNPAALNQEMPGVTSSNGVLTYGAFGGLLGLALGAAGGLARRSIGAAVQGAVVGLILGTLAGALPSVVLMPWHWRHRNDDPATLELLGPLLVHLGLWSAVGLAAGLAFGVGSSGSGPAFRPTRLSDATLVVTTTGSGGSIPRGLKPARLIEAALAGLVGAMVGTVVYEMVGALLFPHDHTTDPFPGTSGMRLLARLCIAGFVGLGAIRALPAESRSG